MSNTEMTYEDAVSRKAVLDAVTCLTLSNDDTVKLIKMLPSVTPKLPKSGVWTFHPEWLLKGQCPYECSECKTPSDYPTNYCSYCGAYCGSEEVTSEHD